VSRTAKPTRTSRRVPPASGRPPSEKLSAGDWQALTDELMTYHRPVQDVFQRREQRQWSMFYLCGQLSNLERKTVEPMVLELLGPDPNAIRGLQHFIGHGAWPTAALIECHQQRVSGTLGHPEGVVIVDGSGFPKQGHHSAGVGHQYCGALGKVANCQEGVFAVYASPLGATFVDARLYLPADWFAPDHREPWRQCGIPAATPFQTEPELARAMVADLVKRGVLLFQWVTADEHFGQNPGFLDGIAALGKWYFAEVPTDTRVWLRTPRVEQPGPGPLGRPRMRVRVAPSAPRPMAVRDWRGRLTAGRWQRYTIKEGSRGPMIAEFAFQRVTLVRDRLPGPRVWLVVRRSLDPTPEVKYYLSNAPSSCAPWDLARLSGWRWPMESAVEEAKGEVGLDHYETRTWVGWHHHMAQTFLAHHFLVRLQRLLKKSAGPDGRASPAPHRATARNRGRAARSVSHPVLSPAPQSCSLSLSSEAYA